MFSNKMLSEATKLYSLGLPLIVSQLAIVGMSTTDTLMAGRYSTEDLAGVAVATGMWHPLLVLLIGVITGVSPFLAQAFGAKDFKLFGHKISQVVWLSALLSIVVIVALSFIGPLVTHLSDEPGVPRVAQGYLTAIGFGVPGLALATIARSYCEAYGNTRTPMIVNICAFLINIALDYIFVFGIGSFEGFGGIGCGWATALIYWLTAITLNLHIAKSKRYRDTTQFVQTEAIEWSTQRDIVKVGLPASIGVTAEVSFFAIVALVLVPFGAGVVAAHQIALNVASVIFMIPLGMSMAIAIRSGHLIGEKRFTHARYSCFLTIKLTAITAVMTAVITLLSRDFITQFFTQDPAVLAVTTSLLVYSAIFQFIDAIQAVSAGALRGYKDTRIPMIIQLFSYWGVGFTVSWSLSIGNVFGESWGAEGFWMGFVAGLSAAGILLLARLNKVTRRAKRIEQ